LTADEPPLGGDTVPVEVIRDPKQREALVQIAAQLNIFQGLLPPPDILERYERMLPGATERLLRMVEKQADHRHELEKMAVRHETSQSRLGL
jgi:uncharacterized membrane protein